VLGVSQVALETGYYMVDLPALLKAKRKRDAIDRLNDLTTLLATANRGMEDAEYKKFIAGLNTEIGVKQANKFDRAKFEELRAMTASGASKAR
jgi:hypothetical protein